MTDSQRVILISIYIDQIDILLNDLKPDLKRGAKLMCKNAIVHTSKFIKEIDKILPAKDAIEFGEQSDNLSEQILTLL